jgi:hypothetical protein
MRERERVSDSKLQQEMRKLQTERKSEFLFNSNPKVEHSKKIEYKANGHRKFKVFNPTTSLLTATMIV